MVTQPEALLGLRGADGLWHFGLAQDLAVRCWDHDPEQRPCDQLIMQELDEMLSEYASPQRSIMKSFLSIKDFTANFSEMLSSGHAGENEVDGYLVPQLGPLVSASLNPVDPKSDVRLEL